MERTQMNWEHMARNALKMARYHLKRNNIDTVKMWIKTAQDAVKEMQKSHSY